MKHTFILLSIATLAFICGCEHNRSEKPARDTHGTASRYPIVRHGKKYVTRQGTSAVTTDDQPTESADTSTADGALKQLLADIAEGNSASAVTLADPDQLQQNVVEVAALYNKLIKLVQEKAGSNTEFVDTFAIVACNIPTDISSYVATDANNKWTLEGARFFADEASSVQVVASKDDSGEFTVKFENLDKLDDETRTKYTDNSADFIKAANMMIEELVNTEDGGIEEGKCIQMFGENLKSAKEQRLG